jgi:hypothetical protein
MLLSSRHPAPNPDPNNNPDLILLFSLTPAINSFPCYPHDSLPTLPAFSPPKLDALESEPPPTVIHNMKIHLTLATYMFSLIIHETISFSLLMVSPQPPLHETTFKEVGWNNLASVSSISLKRSSSWFSR